MIEWPVPTAERECILDRGLGVFSGKFHRFPYCKAEWCQLHVHRTNGFGGNILE